MGRYSCLGPKVNCYNYDDVIIKANSIISQDTFLCTASHNYNSTKFELITNRIVIEKNVWVAANCFVAPGVTMKENSILLACSNLLSDTRKNYIYAGNPAKSKKKRINKAGIPFTGEDPNNKIDRLMSKQVFGMVLTEPLEIQKIKYKLTYFFQQCQ